MHGKLSCLMINDLDAGLGHFENTQVRGSLAAGQPLLSSLRGSTLKAARLCPLDVCRCAL